MNSGPRLTVGKSLFIDQLITTVTSNLDEPSVIWQDTPPRGVLTKSDLRKVSARAKVLEGKSWLDDARISQRVGARECIAAPKLMEAEQQVIELFMKWLVVDRMPYGDQGRSKAVHCTAEEHAENTPFPVTEGST